MGKGWRDIALRAAITGMEICALYTIMALVNFKAADNSLFVPGILVLHIIALGVNRLTLRWETVRRFSCPLNVTAWLLSLFAVIKLEIFPAVSFADPSFLYSVPSAIADFTSGVRPELVIFLCSIPLWLLGLRIARVRVGFILSLAEFQSGLALIIFIYAINAQINAAELNSIFPALGFVALSLFVLALSHAEQASSWLGSRHSTYWFIILGLCIALIIVFGLVAGAIASPAILEFLLTPLRWAWWAFSKFMLYLAEHTAFDVVLNPADWANNSSGGEDPEHISRIVQMPLWLRDSLRFGISVVWLIFSMFALWRISSFVINWLRSHFIGRTRAEVESLDGAFKDDIFNLLRRIGNWIAGLFNKERAYIAPEAASVRQVYREMLAWGASKGVRRSLEQTPYEYLDTLVQAVPLTESELLFITDKYVSTRYGAFLPGGNDLTELRTTWERIKHNGNNHGNGK